MKRGNIFLAAEVTRVDALAGCPGVPAGSLVEGLKSERGLRHGHRVMARRILLRFQQNLFQCFVSLVLLC